MEPEKNKVEQMLTAIKQGKTYVTEGKSEISGANSLKTMVPIMLGETNQPWATGLTVDMGEITSGSIANMITLIIIFILVVAAITIAIRIAVLRIIKRPLSQLVAVSQQQAQGNFDMDVNVDREDELGILFGSLKSVNDKMNELLSNLKNAATQVASGAKQISDSSQELSQGATEQASSIEELSASIEEISSQTKINADHAQEANCCQNMRKPMQKKAMRR